MKKYVPDLWFLRPASCLMLIDIYVKFREESLNGFKAIKQTRFCDIVPGKSLKKYKCKMYGSCV